MQLPYLRRRHWTPPRVRGAREFAVPGEPAVRTTPARAGSTSHAGAGDSVPLRITLRAREDAEVKGDQLENNGSPPPVAKHLSWVPVVGLWVIERITPRGRGAR